jgi:hypothetical protein
MLQQTLGAHAAPQLYGGRFCAADMQDSVQRTWLAGGMGSLEMTHTSGPCGGLIKTRPALLTGDRLYTSWLRLVGGSAPAVPMVELTLTRMGNDIKSVSAAVGLQGLGCLPF